MRKIYLILFVFLLLLQASCDNRTGIFKALQRADSLLVADNDSTAAIIFYQIPAPADTSDETALYNYVSAKINARNYEPQTPELLDLPIEFFKKEGDLRHLAYAYNYKSIFLLPICLCRIWNDIYIKQHLPIIHPFFVHVDVDVHVFVFVFVFAPL